PGEAVQAADKTRGILQRWRWAVFYRRGLPEVRTSVDGWREARLEARNSGDDGAEPDRRIYVASFHQPDPGVGEGRRHAAGPARQIWAWIRGEQQAGRKGPRGEHYVVGGYLQYLLLDRSGQAGVRSPDDPDVAGAR